MSVLDNWNVAVTAVADGGIRVTRTATDGELTALAGALEILQCTALACDLKVKPLRQGRYRVAGTIAADVVQACVVSLEPVASHLDEQIDVEFWPAAEVPAPTSTASDEWFDPEAPDGAEAIENGRIAVGRLVYETVAAALDPYPRKPGAAVEWADKAADDAIVHPFAALSKLKPKS